MVGERLAELREQKALTLRDLEEISGVGADAISKIENGHRKPRPSTLRKLARALGVEVEDFFREPAIPLAEAPREAGQAASPEAPLNPFDTAYDLAQEERKAWKQGWARAREAQGIPQSLNVNWQDRLKEQYAELYPDPDYRYSRVLNALHYSAEHIVRQEEKIAELEEALATRERERTNS